MLKLVMPDKAKKLHLQYFREYVLPRILKDSRYESAFLTKKELEGKEPEKTLEEKLGHEGKVVFDEVMDYILTDDEYGQRKIWEVLAIGEVDDLLRIKSKLSEYTKIDKYLASKSKKYIKEFRKAIENVFNYREFSSLVPKKPNLSTGYFWTACEFVDCLNLFVCPYCNQEYIYTVRSSKGKIRTEIDHFMPKSLYPYFSMSLFNFVPSGKSCNQDYKKAKDVSFASSAYPYRDDYDKSFVIEAQISNLLRGQVSINLKVTEYGDRCGMLSVLKMFQLSERYAAHTKLAMDYVIRLQKYPDRYLEDIKKCWLTKMGTELSEKHIQAILLGYPYEREDIDSCMLGKLKRDLAIQFGRI